MLSDLHAQRLSMFSAIDSRLGHLNVSVILTLAGASVPRQVGVWSQMAGAGGAVQVVILLQSGQSF
jgi:hypothetical protein